MADYVAGGGARFDTTELRTLRRDEHGVLRDAIVDLETGTATFPAHGHMQYLRTHMYDVPSSHVMESTNHSPVKTIRVVVDAKEAPSQSPKRASSKTATAEAASAVALFESAGKKRVPLPPEVAREHSLHSFKVLKIALREERPRDFAPVATQRAACAEFTDGLGVHKMIVHGGCTKVSLPHGEIYEYSVALQQWRRIESRGHVPGARHSHAAAFTGRIRSFDPVAGAECGGLLYISGGVGPSGSVAIDRKAVAKDEACARRYESFLGVAELQRTRSSSRSKSAGGRVSVNAADILGRGRAPSHVAAAAGVPSHSLPIGVSDEIYEYRTGLMEWRQVMVEPPLPAMAGHTMLSDGRGSLVIFGGVSDTFALLPPVVYRIHVAAPCEGRRSKLRCTEQNTAILRCLGCERLLCRDCAVADDHPKTHSAQMELLPPKYSTSILAVGGSEGGEVVTPRPRYHHTASYYPHANAMIIMGGADGNNEVLSDIMALDLTSGVWYVMPTASALTPRYGHSAQLVDGARLLLVGGYSDYESSFVAQVTEVNLVPQRGHFVTRDVRLAGDSVPRFAFASCVTGGDDSSLILFGGLGRTKATRQQPDTNTLAGIRMKSQGTPVGFVLSDLRVQNWTFVAAFPLRRRAASADASSDAGSSATTGDDSLKEPKPIPEGFQRFIERSMKAARVAAAQYEEAQAQLTVAARENTDPRILLDDTTVRALLTTFQSSIAQLDKFTPSDLTLGIPDRDRRIQVIGDAGAHVRQAHNIARQMSGDKPKPFRKTAILDLISRAVNELKEARHLNSTWQPQGEAKQLKKAHMEYLDDSLKAIDAIVQAVRAIQAMVTKRSVESLMTAAEKIKERREANRSEVEAKRAAAAKADRYSPDARQNSAHTRLLAEQKKRREEEREELMKTRKGRKILALREKERKLQRERLRRISPVKGPAKVLAVKVSAHDVAAVRRLRNVVRDHAEDTLEILLPPPPPPSAETPPPPPPPPDAGPEYYPTIPSIESRHEAAQRVRNVLAATEAFVSWYDGRAKAAASAAAASSAAASLNDAGEIRSDALGELVAMMKAADETLLHVKGIRIASNDPSRPATEPLVGAVTAAQEMHRAVKAIDQYVRLGFLSGGRDTATSPQQQTPAAGATFPFKPHINPPPAHARPSSAQHPPNRIRVTHVAYTDDDDGAAATEYAAPISVDILPPHEANRALQREMWRVVHHPQPITLPGDDSLARVQQPVPSKSPLMEGDSAPSTESPPPPPIEELTGATPKRSVDSHETIQQAATATSLPVPNPTVESRSSATDPPAAASSATDAVPPAPSASEAVPPAPSASDAVPPAPSATEAMPPAPSATEAMPPAPSATEAVPPAPSASDAVPPAPSATEAMPPAPSAAQAVPPAPSVTEAVPPAPQPISSAPLPISSAAVLLPASLSDPNWDTKVRVSDIRSSDLTGCDDAIQQLLRAPKRKETLFKAVRQLTPGQRSILKSREANSHW